MATQRKTITNAQTESAIAEALNNLNSRIEKTEHDFVGHLRKVEDRLDQIVDLTKTVAVLQQQTTTQTDNMVELRAQARENQQTVTTSITRIHTRLDEITNSNRDKLDLQTKEIETNIKSVAAKATSTHEELKQWLNRGWGVWVVAILIFGAVQTGIYRWIDGIEKEKTASIQVLKDLSSFKDKNEVWAKQHDMEFSELKSTIKRNSEIIRDLEDATFRRGEARR